MMPCLVFDIEDSEQGKRARGEDGGLGEGNR